MKNEIKLEILKILLRRLLEVSHSSDSSSDRLNKAFNNYRAALQDQNDFIRQYKILLQSQNEQLVTLDRINYYLGSFRKSFRFRIGDWIISTLGYFTRKSSDGNAFVKANEHVSGLIGKQRSLLSLADEPSHYLNTRYRIDARDFEDNISGHDGSVAIIVLNLNGEKHLQTLFESFVRYNTYKNFSFIIIDHGSEDQSVKIIEKFKHSLPIDLYRFDENFTFSYSNNFAVTKTSAEFLLFLNNDIVLIDDVLGRYISIFQQSAGYGIVGANLFFPGKSLFETGNIQHSGISFRRETNQDPAGEAYSSNIENGFAADESETKQEVLRPWNVTNMQENDIMEFPAITGAAMMIRREDLTALHGFDENFIWGYEDVDLCLSCKKILGKKVVSAKSISMIHDESATRKSRQIFNNIVRQHNMNVLNKKHGLFIRKAFPDQARSDSTDTKLIRIAIKAPGTPGRKTENWGDTHFARSLSKALEKEGCRVRIDFRDEWYKYGYLEDDVVLVLRGLNRYYPKSGQLNMMWNISHPDIVSDEEYNGFDHVFIASLTDRVKLTRNISVPVTSLLQCTNASLFYPETNPDIPKCDYLFIGSSRGQYRETVRYSVNNGISLNVFGNNWETIIPNNFIKGSYISNDQLRYYYSSCRVLFNDHWKDMSANGFLSNRLFDAVACGCIVISDHVEGIREIFGDSVKVYHSEEDFINCVRDIDNNFNHYKEKAVIQGGIIRKEHSFEARAGAIMDVIKEYLI